MRTKCTDKRRNGYAENHVGSRRYALRHVRNVVRRVEGVKKVKSSHAKGRTEVIAEDDADIERIKEAIAKQGYGVGQVVCEPYEKRGLFSRRG